MGLAEAATVGRHPGHNGPAQPQRIIVQDCVQQHTVVITQASAPRRPNLGNLVMDSLRNPCLGGPPKGLKTFGISLVPYIGNPIAGNLIEHVVYEEFGVTSGKVTGISEYNSFVIYESIASGRL